MKTLSIIVFGFIAISDFVSGLRVWFSDYTPSDERIGYAFICSAILFSLWAFERSERP